MEMKHSNKVGVELGGPDLGERPMGPDPFDMARGDMLRIKAKIKNLVDRAMTSSSASPL